MSPEQYIYTGTILKWLLGIAWLLPLAGFAIEIFGGFWGRRVDPVAGGRKVKVAAYLAVFCIGTGFLLSLAAFAIWKGNTGVSIIASAEEVAHDEAEHGGHVHSGEHADHEHSHGEHGHSHSHSHGPGGHSHGGDGHHHASPPANGRDLPPQEDVEGPSE